MSIPHDHALIDHIEACVERICDMGCAQVYRIIDLLEQGQDARELTGMTCHDRDAILTELKAIMSIYDAREGGPSCKIGN
ncbi:MAG: hypothetical protein KDH88_08695 [Chromatiales bacterium]|nr:hypothetical protein [Chromatiales bacterium]